VPYGTDTYGVEAYGSEGVAPAQVVTQTVGIPSGEAFGVGGKIQRHVTQTVGIVSAEAFGVTGAKVNFTLTQGTGIPSAEAFGANGMVGRNVKQLAGIPSAEAFGIGGMAMFMVNQLAGIPSAEAFGAGGEVLNNYVPGWTVKVLRLSGGVVAEVGRHTGLKFQKLVSGKGSGTITLLMQDALEIGLLEEELIWRVFYDGIWAFSFFSAAVDEKRISQDMRRTVTFTGPGIADCLEWGTVLPPGYPAHTTRTWSYDSVRALKIWRDLFAAVQARGSLPMVVPSFSDATDSSGAAWTDSISMEIEPGGTLYEYLDKMCAIAGADWVMTPSFGLDVIRDYGTHSENKVRFQIASDQITFNRGRDRSGLRNVGYAEGSGGGIMEASDAGSITAWGRREAYIQAGDSADAATTGSIAAQLVDQSKDERIQITFAVLPNMPDRKVFYDYDVGHWIGAESDEPGITGNYRTVAITCAIDTEGNATVELGLQSLFEYKESRLAKLQANGGGNSTVSAGLQSGLTPGGIISAGVPGEPVTPPTGLVLSTGANENRVYIDATWTAVSPIEPDPVVAYEAELSRDGVGTITAQRVVSAPVRFEPVEPSVSYTVRIRAISRLGRSSTFLGPDTIVAGTDPTVPAQTTGLVMGAAIRSITLTWNENGEIDVVNGKGVYDVQIDTVNTFNSANLRGKRVGGTVMSFTDLPTQVPTAYYGRVRAVDSSGNAGPWSTIATSTTQQAVGTDITPLSIDTALIANAAITTAKIDDLAVNTAKISDVSAGKITTGTLTAALITIGSGGVFRAGRALAPYHYMLIDENGIRFYVNGSAPYTGGTLNVDLSVSAGSAVFTGTITGSTITGGLFRTALSGRRVEIGSAYWSEVRMHSGHGSEIEPGKILAEVTSGLAYTYISTPLVSGQASGYFQIGCGSLSTQLVAPGQISMWAGSGSQRFQLAAGGSGGQSWLRAEAALKLSAHTDTQSILYVDWWANNQVDINTGDLRVNSNVLRINCTTLSRAIALQDYRLHLRGSTDNNHVLYFNSSMDGPELYGNSGVRIASGGNIRADFLNAGTYLHNIPGGSDADTILRRAGSAQVMQYTSTIKVKKGVAKLPRAGDNNPVWGMRPVTFKWKHLPQEELARLDRLRPGGMSVGFIAEEMHELTPDCVTYGAEDEPNGINESGVLAYTVAGLQHVKSLVDDLTKQVKQLKTDKEK
jgi:hypothetical protein